MASLVGLSFVNDYEPTLAQIIMSKESEYRELKDKLLEAGIIGTFNGIMMMIIISAALWIWNKIKQ